MTKEVRIKRSDYGRYSEKDKKFLEDNVGQLVKVSRHNTNYYKTHVGGHLLHLYDSR